jgi:hypothetical protein
VDAPLTAPDALIRPWRTATIVASLVAAIELVLLLGAGVLLLGKPLSHALSHHAAATAAATAPKKAAAKAKAKPVVVHKTPPAIPHVARAHTGVLVLNGNGHSGAAAAEATRLHTLGYPVTGTGNAPRTDYATTSVMYRPGFRGEAIRLARDLGLHAVGPLDGLTAAHLDGGKLVVILGAA